MFRHDDYSLWLHERYGQACIDRLCEVIEKYGRDQGHDFRDNFRIAAVNDPEAMKLFQKVKEAGCCGREDFAVTLDSNHNDILKNLLFDSKNEGRHFLLGYNYGH